MLVLSVPERSASFLFFFFSFFLFFFGGGGIRVYRSVIITNCCDSLAISAERLSLP